MMVLGLLEERAKREIGIRPSQPWFMLERLVMNAVKFFCLPLLALGASSMALAQAVPTDPHNDKSNASFSGREPKPDKSRIRDLKGKVTDQADRPIEGAIIQLKDLKSNKIVDFRTKPDGAYLFYDLNMDVDYELTVKCDSCDAPVTKKLSKFDERKPATLNFEVQRKKTS
jgi:hypothetical protein